MNNDLHLNVASMDEKHDEFLALLSALKSCEKSAFLSLFEEMIEHTQEHFKCEEDMMSRYNYYAKQEHLDEHENLLGEMKYFFQKAQKLPAFGTSYINDYAYDKFKRHIVNIDSQLAMFLKEQDLP